MTHKLQKLLTCGELLLSWVGVGLILLLAIWLLGFPPKPKSSNSGEAEDYHEFDRWERRY